MQSQGMMERQFHLINHRSRVELFSCHIYEGWNFYIRGFCSAWRCPSVLILHFFETPHESRGVGISWLIELTEWDSVDTDI